MTVVARRACGTALTLILIVSVLAAEADALSPGTGSFFWDDTTGASDPNKPLDVYYYRPDVVTADTPVWMILHGTSRNADNYRDYFVSSAKAQGAIVIAPEFGNADWPGSRSYNLGNVSVSESDLTPRDEQDWSFSKIEPLFDHVVNVLEPTVQANEYFMFGHSAGSQFTHRFLEWKPDARLKLAVAANAGWYTMAQYNDASYSHNWPYSLGAAPDYDPSTPAYNAFPEANLENFLDRDMVVLLGDQDQERSNSLRQTAEADAQGLNRLERGKFFFAEGQSESAARGVNFDWNLQIVPGVGHSGSRMAIPAAELFRQANLSPADFDRNGHVDSVDLTKWQSDYGLNGNSDADGDGISGGADFLAWQREFSPAIEAPSYYYVGPTGGNFFNENNWNTKQNGTGSNAPTGSLAPSTGNAEDDITLNLVIDGDFVIAAGDVDIGEGGSGSLTMANGARLDITGGSNDLDFDFDGRFTLNNSTLNVDDKVFLGGQVSLGGGSINAGDDIEIRAFADLAIDGTSLSTSDRIEFFNFTASSTIVGASLELSDRLALNSDSSNVVLTDTTVIIDGGDGDIEDVGGALEDAAGTLTLLGNSSLLADDLREGADLVLGGSTTATIGKNADNDPFYVGDGGSTVTLMSSAASLSVPELADISLDPRDFIFNGVTGLSYSEDRFAWNIKDWNGQTPVTLQINSIAAALRVPEPSTAILAIMISALSIIFEVRRQYFTNVI